jgi:hypothetical protein
LPQYCNGRHPDIMQTYGKTYAFNCGRPFSGQSTWKNWPRFLSVRS